MKDNKKLFLLDSYALIYRAFFAFSKSPRINSKGMDTSAIFGFTNILLELIKKERPTHIAAVFDTSKPTFRHQEFSEYKANRDPTPEGILIAKPYIDTLLESLNISKLFVDGYEADDVIGSLAKKAEKEDFSVYMVTSDKDFAQLVSENIFMYRLGNKWSPNEIWGVKEVLDKFQINKVSQVIDFLGMMGDSVDNIPGLPGVGKKTAQKFINQYGSMEGLISNLKHVKGKLREKIEAAKEQGILSKKLATINIETPIEFNQQDLKLKDFDFDKIKVLFEELEFKTLFKRILSYKNINLDSRIDNDPKKKVKISGQLNIFESNSNIEINNQKISNKKYHLFNDIDSSSLKQRIRTFKKCSFYVIQNKDLGINFCISGIAFSVEENEFYYMHINEANKDKCIEFIQDILEDPSIKKIGYNIKEQIKLLDKINISICGDIFDNLIAHYLLYPEIRHDINTLSQNYLFYEMMETHDLESSLERQKDYACEIIDVQYSLFKLFNKRLNESGLVKLFQIIESPLIHVLAQMEIDGIRLDSNALMEYAKILNKELNRIKNNIFLLSGEEFNISSPKQLGEILFDKMKITDKIKKTKSGQYSTSEETLLKFKNENQIISKILDYRALQKLISTYVLALPKLMNKDTLRIHTTFNQAIASTGRLSSSNPNLQNIPIRTKKGRKVREAFIPKNSDHQILAADYSQIELRIMASLSKDPSMIDAFNQGKDIHLATAAKINCIQEDQVTKEMRYQAKMVNFGIIYGISAFGLSQRLGVSRKDASAMINQYWEEFPKVKEYIEESILKARNLEFVETIFGRKRYLKDINSRNATLRSFAERNAINAPIQGSAADIIKKAMIEIYQEIEKKGLSSKMLLQVHDELVFDMKTSEMSSLMKIVKDTMENTISLNVPLLVDLGVGKNWLEAH